jgi:hypothetical protein
VKETVQNEPSVLVAFVHSSRAAGPILMASGAFLREIREGAGGVDISDYNMPPPDHVGLLVFEGWIEHRAQDDGDALFEGWWRQLTHWELSRMRFGMPAQADLRDVTEEP